MLQRMGDPTVSRLRKRLKAATRIAPGEAASWCTAPVANVLTSAYDGPSATRFIDVKVFY